MFRSRRRTHGRRSAPSLPRLFSARRSRILAISMEDKFGHRISYLRVSITDRCNERCTYCMPQELQEWLPREGILSFEETLRLIRIAAGLGVKKVRVTGGEPLTRRDVLTFMEQLGQIPGLDDIGVSTNGTLLSRGGRRPAGDGAKDLNPSDASHPPSDPSGAAGSEAATRTMAQALRASRV